MRKNMYSLIVLALSIALILGDKAPRNTVPVLTWLVGVTTFLILAARIYAFFNMKEKLEFETIVSKIKDSLWGISVEHDVPSLKKKLNEIIDTKEAENQKIEMGYK